MNPIGDDVKNAVPENLVFAGARAGDAWARTAQHVTPLQDLVQRHAIEEAAEPAAAGKLLVSVWMSIIDVQRMRLNQPAARHPACQNAHLLELTRFSSHRH